MVYAQKVVGKDGKFWIKVWFKYFQDTVDAIANVGGAVYSSIHDMWAIPYENKSEFEDKVGDFLILWTDHEGELNTGGIPEESLSDQPIVPGYTVQYDKDRNIVSSTGFKTKPWGEFQVKGFNALVDSKFLILADDAGLGKSWQVSTALEAKKKTGQLKHGLVLAKASLLYNWRDEIHMHTHEKAIVIAGDIQERMKMYDQLKFREDWTFIIMSYETYRGDVATLQLLDNHRPLDFCVMDEAHKVKNPLSKIGGDIHKMPFKYRYVLTATPLINSPLEGYNYLKFGKQTDMNWFEFQGHFAEFSGYGGKEVKAYKNMKELKHLLQTNMLRRRKKDKLKELPDVAFKTIPVQLTPQQEKLYNAVRFSILEDLQDTTLEKVPSALAKLMRLQQVTDSTELLGQKGKGSSSKLDVVDELLNDLIDEGGEKVILFSRFREMANIIQKRYKKYNPAFITGEVDANGKTDSAALRSLQKEYGAAWKSFSKKKQQQLVEERTTSDRQKEVYKFQNDDSCKLFIGSSGACREGLTLTKATKVIFIDVEWSPAYIEQAFSRAHRIGQKNAVTVYYVVAEGTIDEKVMEIIKRKEMMAQTMIDSGTEAVGHLRAKELIAELAGVTNG